MKPSLLVAKPASWRLESNRLGTWLATFGIGLSRGSDLSRCDFHDLIAARIAMERNAATDLAVDRGYTHILFIDPDIIPDAYIGRDPNAKPIWRTFWDFSVKNPGCVLCAPYCGCPPREPVQVWSTNEDGRLRRIERSQAEQLRGWYQIGAAGTGFMLIDVSVFSKLDPPYFHDKYTDQRETSLSMSQDVGFSTNCLEHGVPMYCNFDCWCAHQQLVEVDKPGLDKIVPPPAPALMVPGDGDTSWYNQS